MDCGGAREGDADHKEWELFDCDEDPLELFNVYHEAKYKEVREKMTKLLEEKMMEIGDEMIHTQEETDVARPNLLSRIWSGGKRGP